MFVIYHKDTTRFLRILKGRYWVDAKFATCGAAKAAMTRLKKKGAVVPDEYLITDSDTFHIIEKTVTVKNLITGEDVVQPVNTPLCCDPSSETYWST
jgi:hypothetical protein